jgi:hypothetical protein
MSDFEAVRALAMNTNMHRRILKGNNPLLRLFRQGNNPLLRLFRFGFLVMLVVLEESAVELKEVPLPLPP